MSFDGTRRYSNIMETRSGQYRAICRCTCTERILLFPIITFIWTALRRIIAYKKWTAFLYTHCAFENRAHRWIWANHTLATRLNFTRWTFELWTFRENLPHLGDIVKNAPNLKENGSERNTPLLSDFYSKSQQDSISKLRGIQNNTKVSNISNSSSLPINRENVSS